MISLCGRGASVCGARIGPPLLRHPPPTRARCSATLQPPDVPRLADAARISLSPKEVEDFGPRIEKVIDWFGQLQAVNLESIEPSLRTGVYKPDNEICAGPRDDSPETFGNREAIVAAVPSYDEPYIKVPKVINKE